MGGEAINIGPREIQRRVRLGWLATAAGLVVTASQFWLFSAAPGWLLAFLLFFVGGLGIFQARAKT